ncbi:hypothetical protein [Coleofasciculus sp. E2-BRE-01]|uniref:hypothetical protein n=1 Tax=Coleofasciculus sp. E2-BRE-01 TaxID=3069524 RepID=UPI00330005B3
MANFLGILSSWENVPAYRLYTDHFKGKQQQERSQDFPDGYLSCERNRTTIKDLGIIL